MSLESTFVHKQHPCNSQKNGMLSTCDPQTPIRTIEIAQTGGNRSGHVNSPLERRIDMNHDTHNAAPAQDEVPARLLPMPATWEDMIELGLDPHTGEPLEVDSDGA